MAKSIYIKGTIKSIEKTFSAEEIEIGKDISKEDAQSLVDSGFATYVENVKKPETKPETKPKEKTETEIEDGEDEVDDLTAIKGVGPKTEEELIDLGLDTFEKIAAADPAELAELRTVSKKESKKFIAAAKKILKNS